MKMSYRDMINDNLQRGNFKEIVRIKKVMKFRNNKEL